MIATLSYLVDEFRNTHRLGAELGRGGQGLVCRTADSDTAIKLLLQNDEPVTDEPSVAQFLDRLRALRTLPVPDGLPLAKPIAALMTRAGYVMRLLDGMAPFADFFPDAARIKALLEADVPGWLRDPSGKPAPSAGQLVHYRNTGGLRHRLAVLSRCAGILAELHGAGLIYGDVSPTNVYQSLDGSQVWLIDADNLHYPSLSRRSGVYTPRYGAPELVRNIQGPSFRSDCHAFAVMAYYLLTMVHPFVGRLVTETCDWADADDSGLDMDGQAMAGLLPWIGDEDDDSNSTKDGLPHPLVLTEHLQRLFQQTFGPGRIAPERRPAMLHWPEALARAEDLAVRCDCGMSWFGADHIRCPYCGAAAAPQLRCTTYAWPIEGKKPVWHLHREWNPSAETVLPRRLFAPFCCCDGHKPMVFLTADAYGLRLQVVDRLPFSLQLARAGYGHGSFEALDNNYLTLDDLRQGAVIFVDSPHPRLVRLSVVEGDQHP